MAAVFISHRGSDAVRSRDLAEVIRAAGHDVWLDEWKITPGDSIIARIEEGLQNADFIVLCLSADGVTAPWVSREWMSTLARQLEGHNVKVVPVQLSGGQLPAILADIKVADLAASWDTGVTALLTALAP